MRFSTTLQCITTLLTARKRGATVPHRAADRSPARWAEATTRQDGAMLVYDLTGWSYAAGRSPRDKTDGTRDAMRCLRHHYPVPAFNALASV
jgi:hypothetical protein